VGRTLPFTYVVKIVQNTQILRHSALQSTDALVLNVQCSCRGVRVMSVVCAKQRLWYAEITIGCDMLNGKATN